MATQDGSVHDVANRTMRNTHYLALGPGSTVEKMRTMMEKRDSNVFAVFTTVRRELADIC